MQGGLLCWLFVAALTIQYFMMFRLALVFVPVCSVHTYALYLLVNRAKHQVLVGSTTDSKSVIIKRPPATSYGLLKRTKLFFFFQDWIYLEI